MSGGIPLLPLYAFMSWTRKTLPFVVTNSMVQIPSSEANSSSAGQEINRILLEPSRSQEPPYLSLP